MKGERYESANWDVRDKGLSKNEICVAIKDVLPSSMKDELEDNQEDYSSFTHEYWCDILSTVKVKYNRKREVTRINKIAALRAASYSDSDKSVRVPRKKKARTGVNFKQQGKKTTKQNSANCYCVLCKKVGMPE